MSPTFAIVPNFVQATPTFGSAAACELPANVRPKARIMAMEIAIDENFFFIDSPFLSFGNQCRTVGELAIVHGSCGLPHKPPHGRCDIGILSR